MRAQRALALALLRQSVEALDELAKDVAVHGHVLVTTPKSIRNLRMFFAVDHCRLRSLPRAIAGAAKAERPKAGREGGSRGRGLPRKAEQSENSKGKRQRVAADAGRFSTCRGAACLKRRCRKKPQLLQEGSCLNH